MDNKTFLLTLFIIFVTPFGISAQGNSQGKGVPQQFQNKVETQNQGEEAQIQVNTSQSEGRSDSARQHMSNVAEEVEALLADEDRDGGIGQQVKVIAQEQKNAQKAIEGNLEEIDGRKGFAKKLLGPDYGAMKNLEKHMAQNQLRIQQLQQLQTQTSNQSEQTQLKNAIQAMQNQNTVLGERLQAESDSPGMLGWLIRPLINLMP